MEASVVHLPYRVNKRSKYKIWSCGYILNSTHIFISKYSFPQERSSTLSETLLEYLHVVFGANLRKAGTCFHHYHGTVFISSSVGTLGDTVGVLRDWGQKTRLPFTIGIPWSISVASLNLSFLTYKMVMKIFLHRTVEMIRNYIYKDCSGS